jgi:hypothetical protein
MTARTWLYGKLASTPLVGGRVFSKKTMTSSVEQHPYLVFKLGNNTNEELAETVDASRQFVQVFVHDFSDKETGDYTKIDEIIASLKTSLVNQSSAEDGVLTVIYLETSQDLNDDTLNTVMKYVRFQLVMKEP